MKGEGRGETMKKTFLKRIVLSLCIIIVLYALAEVIIYKPVKLCTFGFLLNNSRQYIVCEYAEVTGFYWRITESSDGTNIGKYVRLEGSGFDNYGINILSNNIYYGHNKFVYYGSFKENSFDELFGEDDYVTFYAEDWDILRPIIRFDCFPNVFKPLFYLYDDDFI